ncbi:MAG: hypothetical protein K6B75_00820 [Lachnospiraceae bacterium]|nr:hypothetical protein [Lachnospiraceae bacterium]
MADEKEKDFENKPDFEEEKHTEPEEEKNTESEEEKATEEKPFSPILPYSGLMKDNFIIYDNKEYIQDRDLCLGQHSLVSGNVVKYYEADMDTENKEKIPN